MNVRPVYLCILDGFGLAGFRGKRKSGDAIYQAVTRRRAPFFKDLFANHPYATLTAIGRAAGLPYGVMGSSETNHQGMSAGKRVDQPLYLLDKAIADGSFNRNEAINKAIARAVSNNSTLHLMGILQCGKGTVHGSINHIFPILELAKKAGVKDIAIHIFTDGRDNDKRDARDQFLGMLESKISDLELKGVAQIRTVMGRSVAMSRDMEWHNILAAMKAIVLGTGERKFASARQAIEFAYDQQVRVLDKGEWVIKPETDEFIRPTVIGNYQGMNTKDAVIFWNYRDDRSRELSTAFLEPETDPYNYKLNINPLLPKIDAVTHAAFRELRDRTQGLLFVNMTDPYPGAPSEAAFSAAGITPTLGEVVSDAGLAQLRLAGPEKFAHATAWFSGKRADLFPRERQILGFDPSLKARVGGGTSYNLVPEMTAYIEAFSLLQALKDDYGLIVHNYQNPDMVGHTGDLEATISAIAHISTCLQYTVPILISRGYKVVITSDHGNADVMQTMRNGHLVASTKHSFNPVPLWVLGGDVNLRSFGRVPAVATTVLDVMGLPIPREMTERSLII